MDAPTSATQADGDATITDAEANAADVHQRIAILADAWGLEPSLFYTVGDGRIVASYTAIRAILAGVGLEVPSWAP